MNTALKLAVGAPAVVFATLGVGWLVAPGLVAPQLGMSLLSGAGLSTQIGDLASFFLTMAGGITLALTTGRRIWLYPVIAMLGLAATGRLIAWSAHGAALAWDMIAVELIVAGLLFYGSTKLAAD